MSMRVLLVEDEDLLAAALAESFRSCAFEVDVVNNGNDGLAYALNRTYDAVLLDIMLPGVDGLTILKKIREAKNAVPVMLLTAKDDIQDKVTGLDLGADDYLTKPFSTEELMARVRALTRRKGELRDDICQFGDLILNSKNIELQNLTGNAIKLSLKEFQILDKLFGNPHQIITKELLIDSIWGGESNAEYNNVEVYISFIRKKIENLGSSIRIRTARGLGYSLEDSTR